MVAPAIVLDHGVDAPDAGGRVKVVFGNLEPIQAGVRRGGGAVDLGEPGRDGAVVRRRDRVVRVTGELRTADDVLPPSSDFSARRYLDDGAVRKRDLATGDVCRVDVLNRVVLVGRTEGLEGVLLLAVYGEFLQDLFHISISIYGRKEEMEVFGEKKEEKGLFETKIVCCAADLEDAVRVGDGCESQRDSSGKLHGD